MGLTQFMCDLIIQPSGNLSLSACALKHNVCGEGWGGVDSWTGPTACTTLQGAATCLLRGHMERGVHCWRCSGQHCLRTRPPLCSHVWSPLCDPEQRGYLRQTPVANGLTDHGLEKSGGVCKRNLHRP